MATNHLLTSLCRLIGIGLGKVVRPLVSWGVRSDDDPQEQMQAQLICAPGCEGRPTRLHARNEPE